MIYYSDLIKGLMGLMESKKQDLKAPEKGYTIAGFSFTPSQLQDELDKIFPDNSKLVSYKPEGAAKIFSECWPDSLSQEAALRDFAWKV